jgi:hypothetical protein
VEQQAQLVRQLRLVRLFLFLRARLKMADKLVITIECDPKSGGEETADIISKRLRIKIYDKKTLAAESDDDLSDKIIKTAARESCIFLSCNANTILTNHKNCIRVFINSSKSTKKHPNSDLNNANNYDLCINSAIIGTEGAVQVILEYLTAKS